MSTATLILCPADHGRVMSLDDFIDAEVEPGYRYELARGVLEVSNVPRDAHGSIVWYFYQLLAFYHRANPGRIDRAGGAGEFQFLLPAMISGRNPDVAVALKHTPMGLRGRRPASFAVEVVSEGSEARERDYVTKRAEYLAYGLREYWIVDPFEHRVTVLVRDGDAWAERVVVGDASAESLALPGLVVPLAELWAAGETSDETDEADLPR